MGLVSNYLYGQVCTLDHPLLTDGENAPKVSLKGKMSGFSSQISLKTWTINSWFYYISSTDLNKKNGVFTVFNGLIDIVEIY